MFFQGLDFWAPNINIFRDPRWGRGQETYGEDPFLTARMGVAFVTGMQGDDPKYYRTISTPKHYAVHSGPESTRHTADVKVSKHDELDTYLPAFRATVTEAKAGSVMCAYNDINGEPACANQFLLQDQLRGKWNFQGYVVSDCGAVVDIFRNHHFKPITARGFGHQSLKRGMDNECVDGGFLVKDDQRLQGLCGRRQAGLPERERYRHGPRPPLHRAHEAGHVRSAGDGSLREDRRKRTQTARRTANSRTRSPTSRWCCSKTTACCR